MGASDSIHGWSRLWHRPGPDLGALLGLAMTRAATKVKHCGHLRTSRCWCVHAPHDEEDQRLTHELDVTEQMERTRAGRRRANLSALWEPD